MASEQIKIDNIPQNDGDKKLSEKERLAWIKYSTEQLSDDVLRSLRVDVNGVSKYIKDVIYYNSDVEAIMKNPEELIKLQLFLKKKTGADIDISGTYDKKTEIAINEYRKNRNIEGEMAFFQNQNPAFNALIQKYPTRFEEIKKRAALYNELEKMKGEITYLKKNGEIPNITQIQKALAANLDVDVFNTKTVYTQIEGWNGPGSINYLWLGGENVTYAEYIRRLLNKNGIITELFGNTGPSNEQALDRTQKAQLGRAKIFIQSLIARNPSLNMDNKKDIDKIYAMLNTGNVDNALNLINKLTREKFSLTVDFSTKKGLGVALRAIGDTQTAGSVMHSELNEKIVEMKDTQDTNPEALQRFNNTYSENNARLSKDSNAERIIQKKFDDMMSSISNDPTSEYYYLIGDSNKQKQVKAGLMALMVFDETMKQTGPNGLGELAEIYDDMKGLNGLLNFTDENVKMTKEIAIMLASMVVTAGLGAALSGVGSVLRVAQANRLRKAVEVANKAGKMSKMRAGVNMFTGNALSKGAKAFEISASAVNKINSYPIIGNALVFTSLEFGISKYYHSEGEMVTDVNDFCRNLAANTAMFGIFHFAGKGMEKITKILNNRGLAKSAFSQYGLLSAGDVGGMFVLHLIETGRIKPTTEEFAMICAQVVGFRGLMKGMEKVYPKLSARIKTYSEKQNIVAEGAGKQEMKAITADAGKSRTMDSKNNGVQKEVEKIENELLELQKTKKEQEIELSNRKAGYERVKSNSPQEVERLKRLEQAVKDQEGRLLETETSIKEKEGRLMKLADEKTHTGKTEPEIIVEKTPQDIRINDYQKKIEQVDKRLRILDNAKAKAADKLRVMKEGYKKLKDYKALKGRKEQLKEMKKTIKSLDNKVKKLDKKFKETMKEKEILVAEKNRVVQLGDYIEIPEETGKSRRQAVKDWMKQNPKKAIIGTILAIGGVGGATYYILQKDSLGDIIPVIYIPKDDEEDENKNQDGSTEGNDGEVNEGQEGNQDGSTEGGSEGVTPVVPSTPNKGGKGDKKGNEKGTKPKGEGKSGGQSGGAAIGTGSPSGISGGSKPEGAQSAVNLQEQIKAKQVSLLGDLQNIYKNRYQDLKDIGLGDAFFGLDKGVEFDEKPIYLDYDGTINGRITVNEKGEYQITLDNKKAIAGYSANVVITGNDLFETLKKGYTIGNEINKAEVKAYHESREKEEEKRRFYGA